MARGRLAFRRTADLAMMERDAGRMRGKGPTVFAQVTRGVGVEEIAAHVLRARTH
jgi:urease accessory protein